MEERHGVRLGQILWRSRLNEWERKGIEERCEGWWPSLAGKPPSAPILKPPAPRG